MLAETSCQEAPENWLLGHLWQYWTWTFRYPWATCRSWRPLWGIITSDPGRRPVRKLNILSIGRGMSNWRAEIQNAECSSLNFNTSYHWSSWINRTEQLHLVQVMCLRCVYSMCELSWLCLSAASLLEEFPNSSIKIVSKLSFLG